jgi:CHAT domain
LEKGGYATLFRLSLLQCPLEHDFTAHSVRGRQLSPQTFMDFYDAAARISKFFQRRGYEFTCRPAKYKELILIDNLCRKELGNGVASLESMQNNFRKNPGTFWVLEQRDTRNAALANKIVGFFDVYPVTRKAKEEIEAGRLNGINLSPQHIVKPGGNAAAIYIGGLVAQGFSASGEILPRLIAVTAGFRLTDDKEVFTRPTTGRGLELVCKYGLRPADPRRRGLDAIYKGLLPSPNVMKNVRPTGKALRKMKLGKNAKVKRYNIMEKIKILFMSANPPGTTPLKLDEEAREIEAKIRASEYRDSLTLITKWATRPHDLLQSLNEHKPHIVHFSGHGSPTEEIILLDAGRDPKPVTKEALVSLFHTLKDNIRVVVLNACFSRPQAEAITQEIDCAIGMSRAIGDDGAITFAASFYRAIGFGRSVEGAFDQGKAALLLEGIPEEKTPVLITREKIDPTNIFVINSR